MITVIRHGETEWNAIGRQQGYLDSPLTENGIAQAQSLAGALEESDIDICISSDLGRAEHTAEIVIKALGIPLQTDFRLRERNLGIMQGTTIEEFKRKNRAEWEKFRSKDPCYSIPEGESAKNRFDRNWDFFNEAAEKYRGKHLLISAHGGVLDSLIRGVLGIPLGGIRHFSLINGSISRFAYEDGKWMVISWGETAHMKGLPFLDDF